MNSVEGEVPIAIVGKYVEYPDSYMSVREAVRHAATSCGLKADVRWVHSEAVERDGPDVHLKDVSGIVVPGGFGSRGVQGMVDTSRYARDRGVPYLGLCLGMQVMIIDWTRTWLACARRTHPSWTRTVSIRLLTSCPGRKG